MNLPYKKCKCCGKRIGFMEWWRHTKEGFLYLKTHMECLPDDMTRKEKINELKKRYNDNHPGWRIK